MSASLILYLISDYYSSNLMPYYLRTIWFAALDYSKTYKRRRLLEHGHGRPRRLL